MEDDVEKWKGQIEHAKLRLASIFRDSVMPICVATKSTYHLVLFNRAAASFFGRPDLEYDLDDELMSARADGLPPDAIFLGNDQPTFQRAVDTVAADRDPPQDLRVRMQRGDGAERICALHFHRNTSSDTCIFTMRDVTELVRAQEELRATQAQLIQQGKMAALGVLVAGVAHDINTPLGSIKANIELTKKLVERLATKLPVDDPKIVRLSSALDDAVKTSMLACERIGGIVGSLRNFARPDASELEEVDLHAGLDSSLLLCGHLFKNRVDVAKHYGELPLVRCNRGEINQVFMNLLTNAAQAIGDAGTITVTTAAEGHEVRVTIRDDGAGIEAEHLDRIFEPGFTTKSVGAGTGIGLSIAHRIVSGLGGRISADSTPGEGASFTVTLPTSR